MAEGTQNKGERVAWTGFEDLSPTGKVDAFSMK